MFVELTREWMGQKAGAAIDRADLDAKILTDGGVAKIVASDPLSPLLTKAMGSMFDGMQKAVDAAINKALADLQATKALPRSQAAGARDSPDPARIDGGVGYQLVRFEPQVDFDLRVVGAVAAVDQIVLDADAEVAADGAGRRFCPVGAAAHHSADDGHGLAPFQHGCDGGTGRQEIQKRFVEWLAAVNGVMLFGERSVGLEQFQPRQAQPFLFEPLQNGPDQPALDGIGFQQNQRALHGRSVPFFTENAIRG